MPENLEATFITPIKPILVSHTKTSSICCSLSSQCIGKGGVRGGISRRSRGDRKTLRSGVVKKQNMMSEYMPPPPKT